MDLMGLKTNPLDLFSFSALTLFIGSFDLLKPVPDMTYNVFGGTLNLTLTCSQYKILCKNFRAKAREMLLEVPLNCLQLVQNSCLLPKHHSLVS